MPPVAAAVVGAALSSISINAAGALVFAGLKSFLVKAVIGTVLSYAASALSPKPKNSGSAAVATVDPSVTQTFRQALETWKIIYGESRVGGTVFYVGMTNDNKYLHMNAVMAAHEIAGIDEVWLDETVIPVDAIGPDGMVTTGRFANKVRIRKHLGAPGQVADPVLVAELPDWDNTRRAQEKPYLAMRYEYNTEIFPNGVPNMTAFVRGRKVYDSRVEDTVWTMNVPLFLNDYMSNSEWGLNAGSRINATMLQASANIADEYVQVADEAFSATASNSTTNIITLQGDILGLVRTDIVHLSGTLPANMSAATDYYVIPYQFGQVPRIKLAASMDDALNGVALELGSWAGGTLTITKKYEPRYHGGGVVDTEDDIRSNIGKLLSGMAGRAIWTGAQWRIQAGAYSAPVVSLDESNEVSASITRTRLSRTDRFNAVKGIYRAPANYDVPTDYPAMQSETFAEQDGMIIYRNIDLPMTQRTQTARRIVKIELLKSRQEIVTERTYNMKAYGAMTGDTVAISNERAGWDEKEFEVTNFKFSIMDGALVCTLQQRETSEAVYDWNTSEESAVDPAPNSNLPDAFNVQAPSGVAFNSRTIETSAGDVMFQISLTFSLHPDTFVQQGGAYQIDYREAADPSDPNGWRPAPTAPGSATEADGFQGSAGQLYDFRIRAVNVLQVPSSYVSLFGVLPGSGGGIGTLLDYGLVTDSVTTNLDYGDAGDPVTTFEDYGGVV